MFFRFWQVCFLTLACAGLLLGQTDIQRFDPLAIEVKKVGPRWHLLTRHGTLKEFDCPEEAQATLRLIRELRINQRGTIGSSRPVIEYWLSDGKAPFGLNSHRLPTVPFDHQTLKVELQKGQWLVRDAVRPLFAFGPHEADARQALALLQRHQFNRVGYIGDPPAMMYFLAAADTHPRPGKTPLPAPAAPLAALPLPTLGATNPFQFASAASDDIVPIAWQRCQVQRDGAVWKLVEGRRVLAELGTNPATAHDALRVLQHYRFTEQCRTGTSPQSFRYYLVDGQAPRGVMFGLRSIAFQAEQISLRQQNGAWVLWHGNHPLLPAGATFEEAQQALQISHIHGFDRLCWVGSPDGDGFRFLVKEK